MPKTNWGEGPRSFMLGPYIIFYKGHFVCGGSWYKRAP